MLTPVDLETTVFRRGFRGYRTKEVQEFMEHLTIDYEHLYKENINLKENIESLQSQLERYRQVEATLKNTLVLAQSTAEEVKNAGQKQADLILREANHRAEQIRGRVREEIQNELQQLANLKQQSDMFRLQFKKFLEGLGELVERKFNMEDFWDKLQEMTDEVASPTMETSFTEESESEQFTNDTVDGITEKISFAIGD
jgi:cell division initiation protein